MHVSRMTRRTFLSLSGLTAEAMLMRGLTACAGPQGTVTQADAREVPVDPTAAAYGAIAPANHTSRAGSGPKVLFSRVVDSQTLRAIYAALGPGLAGKKVGVKLSSGQPGSNHLSPDLISRIETLNGEHVLEAAEALGVGSRSYELVELG